MEKTFFPVKSISINKENEISLYPNPATKRITINCLEEIKEVKLYNSNGKDFFSSKININK